MARRDLRGAAGAATFVAFDILAHGRRQRRDDKHLWRFAAG